MLLRAGFCRVWEARMPSRFLGRKAGLGITSQKMSSSFSINPAGSNLPWTLSLGLSLTQVFYRWRPPQTICQRESWDKNCIIKKHHSFSLSSFYLDQDHDRNPALLQMQVVCKTKILSIVKILLSLTPYNQPLHSWWLSECIYLFIKIYNKIQVTSQLSVLLTIPIRVPQPLKHVSWAPDCLYEDHHPIKMLFTPFGYLEITRVP